MLGDSFLLCTYQFQHESKWCIFKQVMECSATVLLVSLDGAAKLILMSAPHNLAIIVVAVSTYLKAIAANVLQVGEYS